MIDTNVSPTPYTDTMAGYFDYVSGRIPDPDVSVAGHALMAFTVATEFACRNPELFGLVASAIHREGMTDPQRDPATFDYDFTRIIGDLERLIAAVQA